MSLLHAAIPHLFFRFHLTVIRKCLWQADPLTRRICPRIGHVIPVHITLIITARVSVSGRYMLKVETVRMTAVRLDVKHFGNIASRIGDGFVVVVVCGMNGCKSVRIHIESDRDSPPSLLPHVIHPVGSACV